MLLFVLYASYQWSRRHLEQLPSQVRNTYCAIALFGLITASVFRLTFHWMDVPFELHLQLQAMPVQVGLSIVWGLIALTLMIAGNLRKNRYCWMAGALLIGIVVVKLFFVELGDTTSLARIVSFTSVGVLLLIVGYFAPLPPRGEPVSLPNPLSEPLPGPTQSDGND